MPDFDRHDPGSFCWVELATSDPPSAKGFYGELFGWTSQDDPIPGGGVYSMLKLRGRNVAALFEQRKEERSAGIPPHWNCYVAVESADESAKKIVAAGGKLLQPPFDVMDVGRMAVFADPAGAVLSIWQPKLHVGAGVKDEPGALCWVELLTTDVHEAGRFYPEVFGWTVKGNAGYTEWHLGARGIGGAMQTRPEWGPVPPHWTPYFDVKDVDATAGRAKRLGGSVRTPPADVPNVGRFAVLCDAQGAGFSIYRSARA